MKKNILTVCAIVASSLAFVACNSNNNNKEQAAQANAAEAVQTESADADEAVTEDAATPAAANGNLKIAFFDITAVIANYDYANELSNIMQDKNNSVEKDLKNRRTKLENAVNDFATKYQKGLMTSAAAEAQQKKLQEQEAAYQEYYQKKGNELMEEQQVNMNKIMDKINTFVNNYNAKAGYDMILCNQAGIPVFLANPSLDLTEVIVKGLNAEYVKSKK